MESKTRIRAGTLATVTMFVTLSLSRCWNVQSWQLGTRALGVAVTTRHGLGVRPQLAQASSRLFSSISGVDLDTNDITDTNDSISAAYSNSNSNSNSNNGVSSDDRGFLAQALEHATIGHGHTFPNPAVGCVLVHQDTGEVLGAGFHPKAGSPHAEVFALLEAAGHVESGVAAARSVLDGNGDDDDDSNSNLAELLAEYTDFDEDDNDGDGESLSGPERLFGDKLADVPVTAYVTLEPCCHYGKTPPCAASLSMAKVDRVVVGFRDPNPRVDGGGVKVLEDAGIAVDMAYDAGCESIVRSFVKRILPKDYDAENYSHVNGVMRRGLRRIAGQKKQEKTLKQVAWSAKANSSASASGGRENGLATTEEAVNALEFPAEWMEHLDDLLWKEELVNVRLSKAVKKKKLAKVLGNRVAASLGAHVAQVVGHTVLLYRPAMPKPILDLDDLAGDDEDDDEE